MFVIEAAKLHPTPQGSQSLAGVRKSVPPQLCQQSPLPEFGVLPIF